MSDFQEETPDVLKSQLEHSNGTPSTDLQNELNQSQLSEVGDDKSYDFTSFDPHDPESLAKAQHVIATVVNPSMVTSAADREDLRQQIIEQALRHHEAGNVIHKPVGWFRAVSYHTTVTYYRKRGSLKGHELLFNPSDQENSFFSDVPDPNAADPMDIVTDKIETEEQRRIIENTMAKAGLNDLDKHLAWIHAENNGNWPAILAIAAGVIGLAGITYGALKVRHSRTLKKLRDVADAPPTQA